MLKQGWGFLGTGMALLRVLNYSPAFSPADASSTLPPVMTIKMSLDIAKCPLGAKPAHSRKLDTNLRLSVSRRPVGVLVTHTLLPLLPEGLGRTLAFSTWEVAGGWGCRVNSHSKSSSKPLFLGFGCGLIFLGYRLENWCRGLRC